VRIVFVAVSTRCFPKLDIQNALKKLSDLEYSASEIVIGNQTSDLKPEWLAKDIEQCARLALCCRAIRPAAFFFDVPPDDPAYFEKFELCCRLARSVRVVVIAVRSAPLGSPFNEEVERLRKLCSMALRDGLIIGLITEQGTIAQSCDSIKSLCKNVDHLAVTLDPSCFIYGTEKIVDFDILLEHICHIRLRDTTPKQFQVQIGQGVLEYNRLVIGLSRVRYRGAFCADIPPLPDLDQEVELRKMRLLLESLL
jgi:sugar phosphate isomerase/epimerase